MPTSACQGFFRAAPCSRRDFLETAGGGFGAVALSQLLGGVLSGAAPTASEFNGGLHHRAKARRVIQLFMNGGVSQVDTYDYRPELERRHGETVDLGIKATATGTPGALMKSPFKFRQYGASGKWVSEVFQETAAHVDDLAFLMAMTSKSNVHGTSSYLQNTGFLMPGFPSLGAWISYGLGRLSEELPDYVVLPDARGLPYNNTGNFSSAFLPAAHSATLIDPNADQPIAHLHPPRGAAHITPSSEADGMDLLRRLNERHLGERPHDSRLEARIASFELAARMQLSAPEALDLASESAQTQRDYGLNEEATAAFGKNCLLARRLAERGVRFIQVWSGQAGATGNWDNHSNIPDELPFIARMVDRPIAALLADLKQRGLLEDTLVVWTSEFGRMPCTQGAAGRDHNGGVFVSWLAGAGVKPGVAYGSSDEFGFRAAAGATECHDLHATMLHLLGVDHERLTYRHNGVDRRVTDVHGHVIREILA